MELITIFLSSILSLLTPGGAILDNIVASNIRSQSTEVEQLAVRIDNTPSYQILGGKVDQVRIASRGVQLTENVRIETLEVETDPLNVDFQSLRQGEDNSWRTSLRQPLQAGVRLVLTEEDLNQALRSPTIKQRIEQIFNNLATSIPSAPAEGYELTDIQLELKDENRLRLQMQLQSPSAENEALQELNFLLEVGLGIARGRQLQLSQPILSVNSIVIPSQFSSGLLTGLSRRLDLGGLEEEGILVRILQLELEDDQLSIAAFVRAEPLNVESESN